MVAATTSQSACTLATANKIPLSEYTKLCFGWEVVVSGNHSYHKVGVATAQTGGDFVVNGLYERAVSAQTSEVDISSITDNAYIKFYFNSGTGSTLTATIKNVWLE